MTDYDKYHRRPMYMSEHHRKPIQTNPPRNSPQSVFISLKTGDITLKQKKRKMNTSTNWHCSARIMHVYKCCGKMVNKRQNREINLVEEPAWDQCIPYTYNTCPMGVSDWLCWPYCVPRDLVRPMFKFWLVWSRITSVGEHSWCTSKTEKHDYCTWNRDWSWMKVFFGLVWIYLTTGEEEDLYDKLMVPFWFRNWIYLVSRLFLSFCTSTVRSWYKPHFLTFCTRTWPCWFKKWGKI
jgi:hypothetical protein